MKSFSLGKKLPANFVSTSQSLLSEDHHPATMITLHCRTLEWVLLHSRVFIQKEFIYSPGSYFRFHEEHSCMYLLEQILNESSTVYSD